MIEIELRKPTSGAPGMSAVAWLRVDDDGTYSMRGQSELFDRTIPIRDRSTPSGQLFFDDDPEEWARKLRKAYRTPYLVPVTVTDTKTA